ncbi:MAG: hypothetical protein QXT13_12030 [Pyrobaculum sp.]
MLLEIAKRLYDLGHNVVAVGGDKKPLHPWGVRRRLEWDELEQYLRRARSVGVAGYCDDEYCTVPLDIDDVDKGSEILSFLGENWREILCGQPYSLCVATGPRPKNAGWQCDDMTCRDQHGNVVSVSEVKRGMAIVIRVPRRCAPRQTIRIGAIEVLTNNYQVVAGLHPSGLQYELISPNYGPGVIVDCEDWSNLVFQLEQSTTAVEDGEQVVKRDCVDVIRLSREAKESLVLLLKQLWSVRHPETGNNMHNDMTFALASLAWRRCVVKDDVYEIIDRVTAWGVAEGIETEPRRRHHLGVVDWVYDREGRKWGWRRVSQVFRTAAEAAGLSPEAVLSAIESALKGNGRSNCITYVHTADGMPMRMLCNNENGVVVVYTKKRKKKKEREVSQYKTVVAAYFSDVSIYTDIYTGTRYINAKLRHVVSDTWREYRMVREDEFISDVERRVKAAKADVNWLLILETFPMYYGVVADGFFCDRDRCGVHTYFGALNIDYDFDKAREALLLLQRAAVLHPDGTSVLTATAYAMFTTFSLVQKQHRVKPKFVLFTGPRDSGKTTIATLVTKSFVKRDAAEHVVKVAADVLTPARVGRIQTTYVLATPHLLDEVEGIKDKPDVIAVLKGYVSNFVAWSTALNRKWPAYAGIVMTANQMPFGDPDLVAKIARVSFKSTIPPHAKEVFSTEVLPRLYDYMPHLSAYYLKYAEDHWGDVRDVIIKRALHSWEEAAVEYFRLVAESLGVTLDIDVVLYDESVSYADLFRRKIMEYVRQYGHLHCRDKAMWSCVATLVELGYIPEIREYVKDGVKNYRIVRDAFGLPTATLCDQLRGYLSKNKDRYYGSCIVSETDLYNLFGQDSS